MKKVLIYSILILILLSMFFVLNRRSRFININNVPLNGYTINLKKAENGNKFYFSRGSDLKEHTVIKNNSIILKELQPDSTYYYRINNGPIHKLKTENTIKSFKTIVANSRNSVFVLDNKLNLKYKIKLENLSDSVIFDGYLYLVSDKNLYVYKNEKKILSIPLKEIGKKLIAVKNRLFLSTTNFIYEINNLKILEKKRVDYTIEDFYPYKDDFLIYKKEDGIFLNNRKILETKILSSMVVKGNYLFVSEYDGNVYIEDLRNGAIIYHNNFKGRIFSISISGDKLYVGGIGKIIILNVSDFSNIRIDKDIKGDFVASNIQVCKDELVVSEGNKGVAIINADTGKTLYSFDKGIFAYDVTYLNKKYFFSDPYEGIKIYNDSFEKIKTYTVKGFVGIIYSTGKKLIVGIDKKLFIYNSNLELLSKLNLKEIPTSIRKKYQYLFVSEHNMGFQIINIENPSKPIIAETIYSNGSARNLDFENGKVYLANGKNTKIYNINMIINYEEKSSIKVNGNAFDCIVKNNILYIDNLKNSILMYDISDPEKPRFIGKKNVNYSIISMAIYKDYLICSGGFNGLYIYKEDGASLKLYKRIKDGSYYNKVLIQNGKVIVLKGEAGFDVFDKDFVLEKSVDWVFINSAKIY